MATPRIIRTATAGQEVWVEVHRTAWGDYDLHDSATGVRIAQVLRSPSRGPRWLLYTDQETCVPLPTLFACAQIAGRERAERLAQIGG
jgi:hypothetical protein